MTDNKKTPEKRLTAEESTRTVFLQEMRSVVYDHQGSAFIKFINLAIGIEYLGAFWDNNDFMEEGLSEKRFNKALKKLFPKKYQRFSKSGNEFYLYKQFRCPFVHQLRPGKKVVVTHRAESQKEGTTHLEPTKNGFLVLVLEDFFDDFESACNKLFDFEKKKKLPSKKLKQDYLVFRSIRDNE